MAEIFDPYHTWLGISPDEQPANHYRILGISRFEDDPEVIDNAADRQMAHLRSYQTGRYQKYSQQLLNEVAAARLCLLKSATKTAYDDNLRKELLTRVTPARRPSATTAPDVPQASPAPVLPSRPTRPPETWAPAAVPRSQTVAPAEDLWGNLLGDVGSASKIDKVSPATRASEERRKTLLVAIPAAALLLIAVVALGLMSASQSQSGQGSADPTGHKIAGARSALKETNLAAAANGGMPAAIHPATGQASGQSSATAPEFSAHTGSTTINPGTIPLSLTSTVPRNLTVPVSDPSFETPAQGGGYIYNPTGTAWTFDRNAGIQGNGSAWGAPNAPDGSQTAVLQAGGKGGSISQSINFSTAGAYVLTFDAAGRAGSGSDPFEVLIDSTVVTTITPTVNQFDTYRVTLPTLTAGNHTLEFLSVGGEPDISSFLDNVQIKSAFPR